MRYARRMLAVVIGLGFAASAFNYAAADVVRHQPPQFTWSLTTEEAHFVSSAAMEALRHVAQARADIYEAKMLGQEGNKQIARAMQELNKADSLLGTIRYVSPVTDLRDRIWVARKHLEFDTSQTVLEDLVPIYSSLQEVASYIPAGEVKQHLDKAKRSLQRNNKRVAAQELNAAEKLVVYSQIDLPVYAARQNILQARVDLASNKLDQAQQALKRVEGSVMFLSENAESPLTRAQGSLGEAVREYAVNARDVAKTDVTTAVGYLQAAAVESDKLTRDAINSLVADTRTVEAKIDKGERDTGAALTALWQRAKALSEHRAESASVKWRAGDSDVQLTSDLIDAKLYVLNADINRFITGDTKQAMIELQTAQSFLHDAWKRADAQQKRKVQRVRKQLARLDSGLKENTSGLDTQARQQFTGALNELRSLIRQT
jgi:hypothetical protein